MPLINGEINLAGEIIVHDIDRSGYIIILFVLFLLIILIVGKIQGLKAIIAFIITMLAIFFFMLPQIINGHNAIFITILTSVIVIIVSLIAFAIMQIQMAGIEIKDFWSFIKANEDLDELYVFSKKYNKMSPQEKVIFLTEGHII